MTYKEMSRNYQTKTENKTPEIVNIARQWHEKDVEPSLPTSAKKKWCDLCDNIVPNSNRLRHMVATRPARSQPSTALIVGRPTQESRASRNISVEGMNQSFPSNVQCVEKAFLLG